MNTEEKLRQAFEENPTIIQINKNMCWFIDIASYLVNSMNLDEISKNVIIESISETIEKSLKESENNNADK